MTHETVDDDTADAEDEEIIWFLNWVLSSNNMDAAFFAAATAIVSQTNFVFIAANLLAVRENRNHCNPRPCCYLLRTTQSF